MNVTDKETGFEEKIKEMTHNSYLVAQSKRSEHGINCDQWFTDKEFEKRFTIND